MTSPIALLAPLGGTEPAASAPAEDPAAFAQALAIALIAGLPLDPPAPVLEPVGAAAPGPEGELAQEEESATAEEPEAAASDGPAPMMRGKAPASREANGIEVVTAEQRGAARRPAPDADAGEATAVSAAPPPRAAAVEGQAGATMAPVPEATRTATGQREVAAPGPQGESDLRDPAVPQPVRRSLQASPEPGVLPEDARRDRAAAAAPIESSERPVAASHPSENAPPASRREAVADPGAPLPAPTGAVAIPAEAGRRTRIPERRGAKLPALVVETGGNPPERRRPGAVRDVARPRGEPAPSPVMESAIPSQAMAALVLSALRAAMHPGEAPAAPPMALPAAPAHDGQGEGGPQVTMRVAPAPDAAGTVARVPAAVEDGIAPTALAHEVVALTGTALVSDLRVTRGRPAGLASAPPPMAPREPSLAGWSPSTAAPGPSLETRPASLAPRETLLAVSSPSSGTRPPAPEVPTPAPAAPAASMTGPGPTATIPVPTPPGATVAAPPNTVAAVPSPASDVPRPATDAPVRLTMPPAVRPGRVGQAVPVPPETAGRPMAGPVNEHAPPAVPAAESPAPARPLVAPPAVPEVPEDRQELPPLGRRLREREVADHAAPGTLEAWATPATTAASGTAPLRGERPVMPSGAHEARDMPYSLPPKDQAAGSADRVTLAVTDEAGRQTRIRVAVLGDQVRATIVPPNGDVAHHLERRMDDLTAALVRQGFTDPRITVRHAGDAGSGWNGAPPVAVPDAIPPRGTEQPPGQERHGGGRREQERPADQQQRQPHQRFRPRDPEDDRR